MLKQIIEEKGLSVYKLAKISNIPYTTAYELVMGKKNIQECNIKTVSAIADALNIPIDSLINNKNIKLSNSWQENKEKEFVFPIIQENKDINMSRFHPLKQKNINIIFNIVNKDSRIEKVIVFGSATNIRCNKDSDLDICITLKKDFVDNNSKNEISEKIQEAINYDADIIWNDRLNKETKIYNNIQKGEIIYE